MGCKNPFFYRRGGEYMSLDGKKLPFFFLCVYINNLNPLKMSKSFENPALNMFSADSVSELIATENAIDYAFETKDFPATFKRVDFPEDIEFSKVMRIKFRCTGSASKNRLAGKEFSIPFYAAKYMCDEDGDSIIDLYTSKKAEETAMAFADEFTILKHEPAVPDKGPAPESGKMYTYARLQGHGDYIQGKKDKVSFFTLRDNILKTPVVVGQEKNYMRKLTISEPFVRFFEPNS